MDHLTGQHRGEMVRDNAALDMGFQARAGSCPGSAAVIAGIRRQTPRMFVAQKR